MSVFKGDFTLVFSLMPLQFVKVGSKDGAPAGGGEAACWWENMSWHLFPINNLMKENKSSTKADYGFLKGWRAFLPEVLVILTNVPQTHGKINLLALQVSNNN